MKRLIFLFTVLPLLSYGQILKDDIKEPQSFQYIVEYKEWHDFNNVGLVYYDGDFKTMSGWSHHVKGFNTYDEMIKWLNNGSVIRKDGNKVPRLTKEEFIAAYDLTNMKKLNLQIVTEEKQREVVIEPYKKVYWK